MADINHILNAIHDGDPSTAEDLIQLVYADLRDLAAARMANERPDHTLQATALVNEAFLRLAGSENRTQWEGRGHFFAAAAEAMRRILVESARKRNSIKRGGKRKRVEFGAAILSVELPTDDLIAFDDAVSALSEIDETAGKIAKLRCFAGLSIEEAGECLEISERTAYREWRFARAWLYREMTGAEPPSGF